jgi:D-alanyl-D-alanine carboxypeptidase
MNDRLHAGFGPGGRTLRQGSSGDDVRLLQQLLGISDDGKFGPDTERAVQGFQAGAGLGSDGVVGPDTWCAILESTPVDAGLDTEGSTDSESTSRGGATILVAVESPGGTRITDKRDPAARDLVTVTGYRGKRIQLHHLAAAAWAALVDAARVDGLGEPLLRPVSGYRSRIDQQRLWERAVEKYGSAEVARKWVARPGSSPHHSGRAVDCWLGTPVGSENVDMQRETDAWAWLVQHAEEFGFYPYIDEPWHWEYNPPQI